MENWSASLVYRCFRCLDTDKRVCFWTEGDTPEDIGFARDCATRYFKSVKVLPCGIYHSAEEVPADIPIE